MTFEVEVGDSRGWCRLWKRFEEDLEVVSLLLEDEIDGGRYASAIDDETVGVLYKDERSTEAATEAAEEMLGVR